MSIRILDANGRRFEGDRLPDGAFGDIEQNVTSAPVVVLVENDGDAPRAVRVAAMWETWSADRWPMPGWGAPIVADASVRVDGLTMPAGKPLELSHDGEVWYSGWALVHVRPGERTAVRLRLLVQERGELSPLRLAVEYQREIVPL